MATKKAYHASKSELLYHAGSILSLEVDESMTKEALISLIKQAQGDENQDIILKDDPEAFQAEEGVEALHAPTDEIPEVSMVEIMLIKRENDPEEGQPVTVNGRTMIIPRGKRVRVPRRYVEALQNAVEVHIRQTENRDGTVTNETYEVPGTPFQVFA